MNKNDFMKWFASVKEQLVGWRVQVDKGESYAPKTLGICCDGVYRVYLNSNSSTHYIVTETYNESEAYLRLKGLIENRL